MFTYWGLFLIFAAGTLLNRPEAGRRDWVMLLLLATVPTALMVGLRWKVGPDWQAYSSIYEYSRLFDLHQLMQRADPGFSVLMWLLHGADAPFWALNLLCGLVFVTGLTVFCRRQPNPWLAWLVAFPYLVVVIGMSALRQSVALGFLFLAINAYERRSLSRFTLFIAVGASFHGSLMLMLPICLLSYTHNNFQRFGLLLLAAVFGPYFLHDTFETYARRYSSHEIQSTGVAYRVAMNALAAILFLLLRKRFDFEEHMDKLWRNFSLLTFALALLLFVVPSSTAIDRMILYLFPLQLVILSRAPRVIGGTPKAAGQFALAVIGYCALMLIVFLKFGAASSWYVPYQTIFSA